MKKKFRKLVPDVGKNNLGWFWKKPNKVLHYYLSYPKSTLAITHCGRIAKKDLLVEIENLPHCHYCQYIEDTRLEVSEREKTPRDYAKGMGQNTGDKNV